MIKVENLKKYYCSGLFKKKVVKAIDGVSFEIGKGKTLGLVGNSGSGKTTVGKTTLKLLEPTSGRIYFDGVDITNLNGNKLKNIRKKMQIIYQHPESSLDPRMKIYDSIAEPMRIHKLCSKKEEKEKILHLIEAVALNEELLWRYPHELSGGQIQRAVLARILSMEPRFIVADEPTSMLDISVQAQILNLMKNLQKEFNITYLFISHDQDVVDWMSNEIAIMDQGKLIDKRKEQHMSQ